MKKNDQIIERLENLNPSKILTWTLLFIGSIVMVTPIIFMVSTSFKTGQEVYTLSLFPKSPTFENYIFILKESKFLIWLLNSLWVASFSNVSVLFFDRFI